MSTPNSRPQSRSSSNASSNHGRPVPVLPPDTAANENTENSASGQPLDEDSDNDTRLHHPSSNSRTQFTAQTPAAEKAAIQSLKTKMTFSDHSAPSSTASTPNKSHQPPFPSQQLTQGAMTDPSRLQQANRQKKAKKPSSGLPQLSGVLANSGDDEEEEDDQSDEGSEGEINNSVTISALLSKLDSVRNFLKEAETLHKRFQERVSEPGVAEQLAKLEALIAELKEQEASHLSVLLAVMAAGELKGGVDKKDLELSEDEESEDDQSSGDSEGESPTNQTFVKAEKSDDSLSLRAQIDKQRELNKEKAEDLVVLKQQQELLKRLIAQQKQIQDLEMRQAALLKMKRHAEEQIAEAEAKTAELQVLAEAAEQKKKQREGESEKQPEEPQSTGEEEHVQTSRPPGASLAAGDGNDGQDLGEGMGQQTLNDEASESVSASQEKLLLIKLAELRARKQRVEQLVGLLSAMRLQDEMTAAAAASASPRATTSDQEPTAGLEERPSQVVAETEAGDMIGLSAEASRDGPSELVRDDEAAGMAELQERLRKAEEARKKLRELQEMISQLHDLSPDDSETEDEHISPPEKFHWRDDSGRGRMGVPSSEGEESDDEEEAGNETMNTTLTEDLDPAERGIVEQYEHRLAAKRQEVTELQRQRDELRKTHARLVLLQSQILTPKGGGAEVKPKPSAKSQSRKTKTEEQKALDTTNATWGGSTITDEGEKSPGSSVSLPSAILEDLTHHDSTLPTASAFAGSASVEQSGASQGIKPPFKVTRHTPRNVPYYRMRTISSPTDQTQRKKRKLDSQNLSTASWQPDPQELPRPTNPNPYSAAYFKSPQQQQQQPQQQPPPPQLDASHMTTDSTHYHTSMMYSQLALTSNMCSELLHTQSSLICAICSHLEMFRYQSEVHQHYSALCQYQKELEQYYQDLYRSYSQMFQHHSAQQAGRKDDEEEGQFPSASTQPEPEDPVGSVNERQFEGTQGSTGIASSPTANGVGGLEEEEGGDDEIAGAQLGEATPRMPPPPPPLSSQPLPFLFHGAYPSQQQQHEQQQTGVGDISFTTASADAAAAVNASGVNPGLSASLPAPPNPPPTFNPYYAPFHSPYHMNPYADSSPMSRPAYGSGPPLGSSFAPSFSHSHFSSNSPLLRPNHLPGYPYRSPMSYPPRPYHHRAAMFGSSGQAPPPAQFAPPFPPHSPSVLQHLPPLAHAPFSGHLLSHMPPPHFPPPVPSFNANGAGFGSLRPSTLLPSQAQFRGGAFSKVLADDHIGFHSPSGITAASLQVQPPSSSPSAPSINFQQPSSSNINNCNATSVAWPNLGTTDSSTGMPASLPNPTSTMGSATLQLPSPLVGETNSAPALDQASSPTSEFKTGRVCLEPGPNESTSFPTLAMPSNLTRETGAASLLSWKGYPGIGGLPPGAMATAVANSGGGGGGGATVEGAEQGAEGEKESVSSLPVSIPEELSHLQLDALESELLHSEQQPGGGEGMALALSDLPSGFSVFDALRDTIYSEVATLIANNESRPHFLVELFRELQMLTTDYLRQRALYNLQDLVTRFLTEEGVAREAKSATIAANMFQGWATGSVSEHTPSESGATTEEELAAAAKPPPPLNKSNSQKYDYVEPVHSASSLSTPPNSSFSDEPFASESLGATAVRLDKTIAKIKGEVRFGNGEGREGDTGLKPPVVSPGPLKTENKFTAEDVNTDQLDELIKVIMIEVIPILKENLESVCTAGILAQIKQTIMSLVKEQEETSEKQGIFEAFTKQLETAINSAAEKYCEKQLKECGEDMLVDISEVLFNELTFFRLLKGFKGHPQLSAEFDSMTSQSGTENEEGEDKADQSQAAAAVDSAVADTLRPLDPTLLEALSLVANANLAEEEEALGKSRDDELATSWDTKMQEHDRSSLSADEDLVAIAKVVELSLSESQPFNSTGSGEEDNLDAGIDSFVIIDSAEAPLPTITDDDLRESAITPTPAHSEPLPGSEPGQREEVQPPPQGLVEEEEEARSREQLQESVNEQQQGKDSVASPNTSDGETPPTPLATDPAELSTTQNEAAAHSGSVQSGKEGGEEKAMVISKEPRDSQEAKDEEKIEQATGIGMSVTKDGEQRQEAVSPPATGSQGHQAGLLGINEAVLEAQVKMEQQSTEGVAGILASIDEVGPMDLVGDENELGAPTPEYMEP